MKNTPQLYFKPLHASSFLEVLESRNEEETYGGVSPVIPEASYRGPSPVFDLTRLTDACKTRPCSYFCQSHDSRKESRKRSSPVEELKGSADASRVHSLHHDRRSILRKVKRPTSVRVSLHPPRPPQPMTQSALQECTARHCAASECVQILHTALQSCTCPKKRGLTACAQYRSSSLQSPS